MDQVHAAVRDALASGYCPKDRAAFLAMLFAVGAAFCIAGITLAAIARFGFRDARLKVVTYVIASVIVAFAIGAGVFDLYGLSGCGAHIAEGLTWDQPW